MKGTASLRVIPSRPELGKPEVHPRTGQKIAVKMCAQVMHTAKTTKIKIMCHEIIMTKSMERIDRTAEAPIGIPIDKAKSQKLEVITAKIMGLALGSALRMRGAHILNVPKMQGARVLTHTVAQINFHDQTKTRRERKKRARNHTEIH